MVFIINLLIFYVIVTLSENSVYGGCEMDRVILFDVDGVFLDESRCFDVAALAVYELLFDKTYMNLGSKIDLSRIQDSQIQAIRKEIFEDDLILNKLKSLGVNSNWDMLFIVFSIHLIHLLKQLPLEEQISFLESEIITQSQLQNIGLKVTQKVIDFAKPLDFLNRAAQGKKELYHALMSYAKSHLNYENVALFDIQSPLWQFAQSIYQEWYLGGALFEEIEAQPAKTNFKKGYIYNEKVIVPVEEIKDLLHTLKDEGYRVGIATGRTRAETLIPFEALGILSLFDEYHIATASEVIDVETEYPELKPLGKPNPFTYLVAFFGNDKKSYEDYATNQENRVNKTHVTIVGDSLADLLCSKKINATFIGTLTGLKGREAKKELEAHQADYIVNNVLDINNILLSNK